jgi:hypothetical protein
MAPSGEAYNVDWVVSNNSNVHVANNRDWFTSYTPFETHFGHMYTSDCRVNVVGIGTVELNAKLHNQKRGGQVNSRVITLHDVLYAPSAICNIIGRPILSEYNVQLDYSQNRGFLTDKNNNRAGLVEIGNLPRLRLHGQAEGTSSLGGGAYMINAQWPATERARWEAQKRIPVTPYNGDELYTTEEKAWLKANYGGEFKFLQTFGLSIYKDEDREEGRSIARGFMTNDGEPKRNETRELNVGFVETVYDDEDEDEDDANSFLREMEDDPMSHLADYNFSQAELKWIKKHYQYSSNFMLSYCLKPYNQEDCDEAKSIIQALMDNDE